METPPEAERDLMNPGPLTDVVTGQAVGFYAGQAGQTIRGMSRVQVRVHTNENCATALQFDDYLLAPRTVVDLTIFRDRLPALQAMVRGPDDVAREREAQRAFEREFYGEYVRGAMRAVFADEFEYSKWSAATVDEIQKGCESAESGSPLANAVGYARARMPISFQGHFHRLHTQTNKHHLKPIDKLEVLEQLPPPQRPIAELAASVAAGASKGSDLTPLVTQILQRLDQQAAENAKLIQLLVAREAKPAAKDGGK